MKIRVTAQIPAAAFRSEWDDPTEAAQEFVRFAEDLWLSDLRPLREVGIGVSVQIGVTHPDNPPAPGVEVHLEPYIRNADALDMMAQTRELLTAQAAVWERWLQSPAARALYRG